MTYKIIPNGENSIIEDPDGIEIATVEHPFTTPEDIIDAILDDMGVGKPQKEAFKVLFTRDWEVIEDTQP